jgi:hypothetical protein
MRPLSPVMNAAQSGAMAAMRNARARIAVRRAAQSAANATPKFLPRNTTIKRIRLVEKQVVDTLLLARLSIREAPLEQHAVDSPAARIAKADSVARRNA